MSSALVPSAGNPFRFLWSLGYRRIVPVVPLGANISERSTLNREGSIGKAVGYRGRDGLWRGLDFIPLEATLDDIDRWHATGADVGLKMGGLEGGPYIVAIDADTHDPDLAAKIADEIGVYVAQGLPLRIGQAPKAMFFVRCTEAFAYARVEFGKGPNGKPERVELLTAGRYAKMFGDHPGTQQPYSWVRALPHIDALPVVPPAALEALLQRLAAILPAASEVKREGATTSVSQDSLRGDPALIEKAVRLIPNTDAKFPEREDYRQMGYAIKASMPDDGPRAFEIFSEWCDRWTGPNGETNDPDVVASDWRRMKPPFRVGASWIYEQAATLAPGRFDRAEQWFDKDQSTQVIDQEGNPVSLFGGAPPAKRKFAFEPFDSVAESALTSSTKPLVRGLLDQGAMTVLYGESNVGKTFVAMALSYAIASGGEFGGLRATQGRVVYIAAEGGVGARKRAAALMAKHGPCADFLFLLSPVNLLNPAADLAPLIEGLQNVGPVVFVVTDTLSRVMAGGDENSSTDMGALVRHLDAIRAATGAHVMAVHHTGKDLAKGARGHSLLRAATDTEIEISEGRITVTKQRDLDRSFASGFDLEPVTLGIDPEGEVVTSATVKLRPLGPALTTPDARETALRLVREGEWRRDVRSGEAWVGVPVALGLGIVLDCDEARGQVRDIVNAWLKDGSLIEEIRADKHRKTRVYVTVRNSVFD